MLTSSWILWTEHFSNKFNVESVQIYYSAYVFHCLTVFSSFHSYTMLNIRIFIDGIIIFQFSIWFSSFQCSFCWDSDIFREKTITKWILYGLLRDRKFYIHLFFPTYEHAYASFFSISWLNIIPKLFMG